MHRRWYASRRLYVQKAGRAYPVAPGYESIVRVAEVGRSVKAVQVGDLDAIDAPRADGHLVSETMAAAGLVPTGVQPERAVFFVLARVALGGVHDAELSLGDSMSHVKTAGCRKS
jgi:hypothetical protein